MPKYVHQTSNQIIFDRVRDLTTDMTLIAAYLENDGSAMGEVRELRRARDIVFNGVYRSLRSHWSSGIDENGHYLPPDICR